MSLEIAEGGHWESPGVCPGVSVEDADDDLKSPFPSTWTNDPVERDYLYHNIHHIRYLHNKIVRAHAGPRVPKIGNKLD